MPKPSNCWAAHWLIRSSHCCTRACASSHCAKDWQMPHSVSGMHPPVFGRPSAPTPQAWKRATRRQASSTSWWMVRPYRETRRWAARWATPTWLPSAAT
ncbi:Uncharacterised protein [Mycobacteroides abscessus subsp. abscessus]|nr:Uncharacterised protein [Mycobacteroides abscessus subsp. abscessus]